MTTIEEQLEAVENTLKKCAEELGRLNIDNNRIQELNQEFASDIHKLKTKIAKKTHSIEQEESDKQIIHQKLVKAERIKEVLEMQHEKRQTRREQQQLKEQIENQRQRQVIAHKQTLEHREAQKIGHNHPNYEEDNRPIKRIEPVPQKKIQMPQQSKVPITKLASDVKPSIKVEKVSTEQMYGNSQKGEYEPPALFEDENDSDSDSEQDNSKVLEKLKQKLKQDKEELDQEDD